MRKTSQPRYTIEKLVDVSKLEASLKIFSEASRLATALITFPGEKPTILTGWRDACTKFHLKNPESALKCKQNSDAVFKYVCKHNEVYIHQCVNGLYEGAAPIFVNGVYVASLFVGQVFCEPPDLDFFREQARKMEYDIEPYMKSIEETPVIELESFRKMVLFLKEMADSLAQQGLRKLQMEETEAKAQQSESLLATIINTLPDLIWLKDKDGVFRVCNKQFTTLFNRSLDEILGKTDYDFVDREQADFFVAKDKEAIRAKTSQTYEEEVVYASDGRTEILETVKTPMYDADGELLGVLGIARDITDRKAAEEALRDSEQQYRLLADNQADVIWRRDLDFNLTYISPSIEKMTGYTVEEKMRQPMQESLTPETMRRVQEILKRELELDRTGKSDPQKSIEIELEMFRKDGSTFFAEASCSFIRDADGKPIGVLGVNRDITARLTAEKKLIEQTALLQAVVEQSPTPMILVTASDHIIHLVNQASLDFLGLANNSLLGRTLEDTIPLWRFNALSGEPLYPDSHVLIEALHGEATHKQEVRIQAADGQIRYAIIDGVPIRDSQGEIIAAFLVFPDITDRKRMEEALEKQMLALTQPLSGDEDEIQFEQLFNIDDLQRIQDEFSVATGVASIITSTDGKPITKPSNFCRLCSDIIRKTDLGLKNCFRSDASLGKFNQEGPSIQPCLSGGLWDAGASIVVGGRHLANWLIGQVRDETQTEESIRAYARRIGADEDAAAEAYAEVTVMPQEQFKKVAQSLYTLAEKLSTSAYHNILQARMISRYRRIEHELTESERLLLQIAANYPNSFVAIIEKDLTVSFASGQEFHRYQYDPSLLIHKSLTELIPDESGTITRQILETFSGAETSFEHSVGDIHLSFRTVPLRNEQGAIQRVLSVVENITAQKNAEQERSKLQEQLNQAQKMESIGRLAGGVAHDFNNMLGVILGNTELALADLKTDSQLRNELHEIRKAAERSTALTRQLLAFARKQTIAPQVLDLNHTVEGMLKMLRRLIGEDIQLVWSPGANLRPIKIDPSQVDQILANLCVNARDAIEGAGSLTIETRNVDFTEEDAVKRPELFAGEFVQLTVTDTGTGISNDDLQHIFDPFFSTKELGKGTGLGLSTVYGIARQNHGFVNVYSELGEGTAFKIYLPAYSVSARSDVKQEDSPDTYRGSETILLVEDEAAILNLTTKMLEKLGYQVLSANIPAEAIRIGESFAGKIDLLITDVVMPEMNGRDLAKNLLRLHPNMHRLFMSGYTADVIAHHGVLDPGVNFIQKPFSLSKLTKKIREVLQKD